MIRSIFTNRMRFKTLLFCIVGSLFIGATTDSHLVINVVPAQKTAYKNIIFDLGDVMFTTSGSSKFKSMMPVILQNPSLLIAQIAGFKIKEEFFKLLTQIPAQSSMPMFNQAKQLPAIMVDWQTGAASCSQILTTVRQQIDQSNYSKAQKKLFISIAQLIFDPETFAQSQVPITSMVKLAAKLKAAGYRLYVLSNWDAESFKIMQQRYPKIFNLFDGIMISGEEKMGKPCYSYYQRLVEKYDLHCSQSIFIDDEIHNTQAASDLGFTTIVCDKPTSVAKELIRLGVSILKS